MYFLIPDMVKILRPKTMQKNTIDQKSKTIYIDDIETKDEIESYSFESEKCVAVSMQLSK